MTKIENLEQLIKTATPGPWSMDPMFGLVLSDDACVIAETRDYPRCDNARFTAAADPQTVLLMIEALRLAGACVKAGVSGPNEGIPTWASNMLRHLNPLQDALAKLEYNR